MKLPMIRRALAGLAWATIVGLALSALRADPGGAVRGAGCPSWANGPQRITGKPSGRSVRPQPYEVGVGGELEGGFASRGGRFLALGALPEGADPKAGEIPGGHVEEGVGWASYFFNTPVDLEGDFTVREDWPVLVVVKRFGGRMPTAAATFFLLGANPGDHLRLGIRTRAQLGALRVRLGACTLRPIGVVQGKAAAESQSPETTLSQRRAGDRLVVALTARDSGGSGVAGTYYFAGDDGGRYTRPLRIAPGTRLVFWSVDAAGNEESAHELTLNG